MWKNNLKIAWRAFEKNGLYSFSSVLGLAVGMAFCLLMAVYLKNELTYDHHHELPHNIFRVVFSNYEDQGSFATTPLPIGPALSADFPEIEAFTRVTQGFKSLVRFNNNRFFETINFVDPGCLDIFKFEFIHGNASSALVGPNKIILSQSASKKYFGDANPIGKELTIGNTGVLNCIVTGVYKNFPQNSHLRFDIATSFATFEKAFGTPDLWLQMPKNYTYIRLVEGQHPADFSPKLLAFAENHVGSRVSDIALNYHLDVQNIMDIHLNSHLQSEAEPNARRSSLLLLAGIAILILLIACVNYINYAITGFFKRMREIGIRKVVGASRGQLRYQYFTETLLVVLIAAMVGFVLGTILVPFFNGVAGKAFVTADLFAPIILTCVIGLVLLVTGIAGFFPTLVMLKLKIITALKGTKAHQSRSSRNGRYLVVAQFAGSITLMIATIVVIKQMQFGRDQFRKKATEEVVVFKSNNKINTKFEYLRESVLQEPGVSSISSGSNIPTFYGDSWPVKKELDGRPVQIENYAITNNYLEALDLNLVAGRDLHDSRQEDIDGGFILNETAVQQLGFSSNMEALGQTIYWGSEDIKEGTVRGVVEDFHFQSLRDKIEPAIIQFPPYEWMTPNFVAVRIASDRFQHFEKSLRSIVSEIDPNWLVDLHFMDDNFDKIHQSELQHGRIFGAFAGLAILISCLGLLGLVSYAGELRMKEISVRKIVGANVFQIVSLLSREFLILVAIGSLIAVPLAYILMNSWLQHFAYHISIKIWMAVIPVVLTLLLAFLTMTIQSVKAAVSNPINFLRED